MAKRGLPTVKGFFQYPDGKTVPFESLSEEERLRINKVWIERWERTLPEKFAKEPEMMEWLKNQKTTEREYERYFELFPEKRNLRPRAETT